MIKDLKKLYISLKQAGLNKEAAYVKGLVKNANVNVAYNWWAKMLGFGEDEEELQRAEEYRKEMEEYRERSKGPIPFDEWARSGDDGSSDEPLDEPLDEPSDEPSDEPEEDSGIPADEPAYEEGYEGAGVDEL